MGISKARAVSSPEPQACSRQVTSWIDAVGAAPPIGMHTRPFIGVEVTTGGAGSSIPYREPRWRLFPGFRPLREDAYETLRKAGFWHLAPCPRVSPQENQQYRTDRGCFGGLLANPLLAQLEIQFLDKRDDPPFSTTKVVGSRITRCDSGP